ncbi:MAG: signal peptidase I, partial [Bacteroidota bacterium]
MKRIRINWDLIKDIIFGIFTVGVWFLLKTKPGQRKSVAREWFDAIVFAVIAATIIRTFLIEAYTIPTPSMEKSLLVGDFLFVSKVSYGARVPMTPLSFPFAHNTMPIVNGKSYLEWIKVGYHRLPGFGSVKRGDCVVFNWPAEEEGRPVDKKENYIKRCIAIAGDTVSLRNQEVFINGKLQELPENSETSY